MKTMIYSRFFVIVIQYGYQQLEIIFLTMQFLVAKQKMENHFMSGVYSMKAL